MRWVFFVVMLGLGSCMKPPSPLHSRLEINLLLDNWHKAAAIADEDTFFGSMTKDAIYLGTDKTERWTKSEFENWSKQFCNCLGAPIFRQKIGIFVYVEAIFF